MARNIGEAETLLRGRIPYTASDGSAGEIAINEVRLRPGEVKRLNLSRAANLAVREEIASAGLELEYDGKPGSVIVSALSASRSRDHVYGVPMLDPAAQQSSTGGYPWRIEGGSSTYVYIKNVSDKSQQYHLQLSCEVEGQQGEIGVYSPGLVTVEAGQTITLDIRQLRDEQVADEAGRVIPVEANRGQVMWSVRGGDNLSLIGRAEQADFAQAVSSSYACQNCCPDSFNDGWCDPFSVEGIVGSIEQFTANQQDRNCYGTILTSYVVFASWSSSNTSIATVDGNGFATAQGVGSTDIFASWFVSTFLSMEGFPTCIEDEEFFFASSVCQVFPRIDSILPATLNVSTGDPASARTLSVNFFPPNQSVLMNFQVTFLSNFGGTSQANLAVPSQTGFTPITTTVKASPDSSSGVFAVRPEIGGNVSPKESRIVVPPQIILQMFRNEARGLSSSTARPLMGWSIRNRFGDQVFFSGQTTYQVAITQSATVDPNVTTGEQPELDAAASVFDGFIDPSSGCQGFWSPTNNQWTTVNQALGNPTTTLPSNVGIPFNYGGHPEMTQIVYFSSVGLNTRLGFENAPAFLFVRKRNPSDPSVIQLD